MVDHRRGRLALFCCLGGHGRRTPRVLSVILLVAAAALPLAACSSPGTSASPKATGTVAQSKTNTTTTVQPPTQIAGLGQYLPLFPFASAGEVGAWQESYRVGGHQPWHLDASQTALAFANWLGFAHIDTVTHQVINRTEGHVSVGFQPGGVGSQRSTSAIVHLVRWGGGSNIPWEVVGTDDTTFSIDRPGYGSAAVSPVQVGGTISGVDENIKVQVRSSTSATALGGFCCIPAGGTDSSWNATVAFNASRQAVVTIAAQTGGHLTEVERFTVTGLRIAGSTPSAAACDESAMLAVVTAALPLPLPDRIVTVRIQQCRNGYARVFAVPSNVRCGQPAGSCYNNEQVFLKDVGGSWTYLDSGSGIDCADPHGTPAIDAPACKALGLS